jgi:hypothetical protein
VRNVHHCVYASGFSGFKRKKISACESKKIRQDEINKQHINGMYLMHLVCVALKGILAQFKYCFGDGICEKQNENFMYLKGIN